MRERYRELGKVIPSILFEQELVYALNRYMYAVDILNVSPPFLVMISMLGIKGYNMVVSERMDFGKIPIRDGIDRNDLILQEIVLESTRLNTSHFLRPAFDMIWNAAGWPASQNYDKDGVWTGHKKRI